MPAYQRIIYRGLKLLQHKNLPESEHEDKRERQVPLGRIPEYFEAFETTGKSRLRPIFSLIQEVADIWLNYVVPGRSTIGDCLFSFYTGLYEKHTLARVEDKASLVYYLLLTFKWNR